MEWPEANPGFHIAECVFVEADYMIQCRDSECLAGLAYMAQMVHSQAYLE